ncbi:MAG: helix-turn-helix domain-containing protein [Parvibaculum sp.]|nr:helix-turn-helix domain-containing protein [Parvibaculum sp.]
MPKFNPEPTDIQPPVRRGRKPSTAEKSAARLAEIAEAATVCFSEAGFRRTQVADIARQMGVSAGTLYLYADSKGALFHLAVMHVTRQPLTDLALPVTDPGIEATLRVLTDAISRRSYWPTLYAALASDKAPDLETLEAIGGEIYDTLTEERRTIWLLDACNLDIPELNTIYRRNVRGTYLMDLAKYMERSVRPDLSAPQKSIALRAAVEIIAWAAMHRRRERGLPDEYQATETEARNASKRAFAAALLSQTY